MDLNIATQTEEIISRGHTVEKYALEYAPSFLKALLVLFIGFRIIKWINKFTKKGLEKAHIDPTVSKFLSSLISICLKVLLLLSVAGMFGIQTTSFIALLGAAGLAIGMSLQGSLSNFAGGVLLLLFKPYAIDDLIEIQGEKGHVIEIGVFTTTLITLQNNTAIIPNGPIINGNIINYSSKKSIRVDVNVGIAYDASIDQAKTVLLETINNNKYMLSSFPAAVYVKELGDSSVNLIARGYAIPRDYRNMYFSLTEEVKKTLDKAGIEIPFPQRVIYTKK